MNRVRTLQLLWLAFVALPWSGCFAGHDIEYVAEHLPEVAMDNRYATLPIWGGSLTEAPRWQATTQVALATTEVGTLSLDGPMFSLGLQRHFASGWELAGYGFYDALSFSSGREYRPLQTLFAPQTPIDRPVEAVFTDLHGRTNHFGAGLIARRRGEWRLLGEHRWLTGVQWERVSLREYSFDYELLAGPRTGATGRIDFDNDYDHITPFVGLELPRNVGQWTIGLHALFAYPLPRRGVVGHITGPGFDLTGDTAANGNGKHFGDPSLTLGLDLTYRPAGLTVDLGTALSQWLLEPLIHQGIDNNMVLSVTWRPH